MTVRRDTPYTKDDFIVTTTPTGRHTVRWKHNNRAIRTFSFYNSKRRANHFIKWLIEYLNEEREALGGKG